MASWTPFAVLIVIATAAFLGGNAALSTTFASGEPVTITLDPADDPVLYASAPPGRVSCTYSDGLTLIEPASQQGLELDGVTWELIAHIEVPAPGEYQVGCHSETDLTFGIGTEPGSLFWLTLQLAFLAAIAAWATSFVVLRQEARREY